jgi:hypothetical protein
MWHGGPVWQIGFSYRPGKLGIDSWAPWKIYKGELSVIYLISELSVEILIFCTLNIAETKQIFWYNALIGLTEKQQFVKKIVLAPCNTIPLPPPPIS